MSGFDRRTTASMQGKPNWLWPIMIVISTLGSPVVLAPVAFVLGVLQIGTTHKDAGLALLLACMASVVSALLKFVPRRIRPDTPYVRRMLFKTYSFPSGHAFSSAVIYGLAACFGYMYLPGPTALGLSLGLLCLVLAVGFSRIYLGAHYVLDVLGGWLFAAATLALLVAFLAD